MTLSLAEYLGGAIELAAIVAALGFAAWRMRRALLPGWGGAPARLVELVLGVVAAIWVSQAVGTFAAFGDVGVVAGSLAAAALAAFLAPRFEARRGHAPTPGPPAPPASRIAWACAALVCSAVAAAWMVPTLQALAGGMDRADTLWYHMPLAATWAQTGNLGAIDHFDPIFFAAYYPANSEVLHAIPILAFGRDIVSPLLNLGFLAIGLLAAYCIGRPYGLGPHSLIGGAIALGSQQLVEFQAGEALNDITGVAFLLAAVAVLVNGAAGRTTATDSEGEGIADVGRGRGSLVAQGEKRKIGHTGGGRSYVGGAVLAVAGLSAGVAAGTKLSFLAPVLALAVGVAWIAGGDRGASSRGGREPGASSPGGREPGASSRLRASARALAWFSLPALAAGGYWYVRNAVAIGNPIPFTPWGPLGLPSPERNFELREPFSVAHYLTDWDVWSDWFIPGLDESFGFLWPLVIAGFAGAGIYALWRGASPLIRVLGAVVLFTALAYVFTPLTAAGEEGAPIAFEWNVRYIAPAAAIGLALLPVLADHGPRARAASLAGLSVVAVATIASLVQWEQGHVKGAVATGAGVLAAFAALAWLHDRDLIGSAAPPRIAAALAALVLVAALGAGWWEQRHYLERRYENLSPQLKLAEAARWARGLEDAKVAVSGVRGVFNQYPFYGTKLSNEVHWLGIEGDDGAFLRIPDCERWRAELAAGGYTHVVTTYDPFLPGELTDTKEALWTREDPAAREILRDGPVSVFELEGAPDPSLCGDLPGLSAAELNGDSVNAEPLANQPPAGFGGAEG